MKRYESWTRQPKVNHQTIVPLHWRDELPDLSQFDKSVLPFGLGRSYGDSCLNEHGILLDVTGLNQFIAFDEETGILRCEGGVSIEEILKMIVPRGWFVPVTAGTKYVSVGGAIANDVHGKNHHTAGTFGCHISQFELWRSDRGRVICSPTENKELYEATIGGLGLTGVILWADIQLKRIPTPFIDMECIKFRTIDEFFDLSEDSHERYHYTVSWVDCLAQEPQLGRGLFTRGNFYDPPLGAKKEPRALPMIPMPVDLPSYAVNPLTVKLFNELYYNKQLRKKIGGVIHYNPFFYPLDAINDWYKVYGKAGFLQYQFVIPYKETREPIKEIFRRIAKSGQGSPLVVFKTFGDIKSPGMLSFPRPGVTLALDFAFRGEKTLKLLDELDRIVFENGGALYPAKDARMSGASFRASYPRWEEFADYMDPKFSSSFWRRVTSS